MLLSLIALFFIRTIFADPAQELIHLEEQLTNALAHSNARTVESLWADDLIFVGTTGKATSKLERLSGMNAPVAASAATVAAATNDQVKVRLYGQTAVVTLQSTWT